MLNNCIVGLYIENKCKKKLNKQKKGSLNKFEF